MSSKKLSLSDNHSYLYYCQNTAQQLNYQLNDQLPTSYQINTYPPPGVAAACRLDAVVRVLPGVMGNALSGTHESFEHGLLEHPHYTRPAEWEGETIPDVLTSGNHAAIEKWRHEQALRLTAERRPDLMAGGERHEE